MSTSNSRQNDIWNINTSSALKMEFYWNANDVFEHRSLGKVKVLSKTVYDIIFDHFVPSNTF